MQTTPDRRERDYEIGHSQGSFCMTRCKNTSDVFVAPVFTGCNERRRNWKFLSAATSYARSPIVYTVHTQSFQSRFCSPRFFLYSGETCAVVAPRRSRNTMSGIRKKRLAGNTLSRAYVGHVSANLRALFIRKKRQDRLVVTEYPRENDPTDTSSELPLAL